MQGLTDWELLDLYELARKIEKKTVEITPYIILALVYAKSRGAPDIIVVSIALFGLFMLAEMIATTQAQQYAVVKERNRRFPE